MACSSLCCLGRARVNTHVFAARCILLDCFGTYSPAASGVWGRRGVVAHGVPPFGIYRQKITPKKLLAHVATPPAWYHDGTPRQAGQVWLLLLGKKSAGGSQRSRGRQCLGMQVSSSLAGQEHPTHKSYPGVCAKPGTGASTLLTQGSRTCCCSLSHLSFHSAPRCQGEEKETTEKLKKSSCEQALPWLLSVGQQARAAGESKRIWGLAFPNN